jgi:hypothetical protein
VTDEPDPRRFLTISQTAEELKGEHEPDPGLLSAGELRGIQVGGRGVWRIGVSDIEDYIAQACPSTAERISAGEIKDDREIPTVQERHAQPILDTRTPPTAPVHVVSPGRGSKRCAKTYPC